MSKEKKLFVYKIAKFLTFFIPIQSLRKKARKALGDYLFVKYHLFAIYMRLGKNTFVNNNLIIERLCKGNKCIVVGSAPNLKLPKRQDGDIIIGANGGGGIAQQFGLKVSIFCTTKYLFRKNPTKQEKATCKILKELSVSFTYLHGKNDEKIELSDFNISSETVYSINDEEKLKLIESVCGFPLRVSTGVFAVAIALLHGAKSVELVGFSLDIGHFGMQCDKIPRDHISEDSIFFEALEKTKYAGKVIIN